MATMMMTTRRNGHIMTSLLLHPWRRGTMGTMKHAGCSGGQGGAPGSSLAELCSSGAWQ